MRDAWPPPPMPFGDGFQGCPALNPSPASKMKLRCAIFFAKMALRFSKLITSFQEGRSGCAVSSVVEHYLDTVGVGGSNPPSRTIFWFEWFSLLVLILIVFIGFFSFFITEKFSLIPVF
jgi:hypothetical protein